MTTAKIHQRLKDLELYVEVELLTLKNEIREHEQPEPGNPEIGKWYKWTGNDPAMGRVIGKCDAFSRSWKLDVFGAGANKYDSCRDRYLSPATPEEIESLLIAEAIKIGFKNGVTVLRSSALLNAVNNCIDKVTITSDRMSYDSRRDALFIDCFVIYCQGMWAEIIEQPVTIAGESVVYSDQYVIKIGDKYLSKELIKNVIEIFNINHVTGIEVTKCNGEKVIVKKHEIENLLKNWK
jgi:hypothetical protein